MSDSITYSRSKLNLKVIRQNKVISFLSSIIIAFLGVYYLGGDDFTPLQDKVMFLLFMSIGFWVTEAIPPFAVSIMIIGFLVFTMSNSGSSDIDVSVYLNTWSDGVIWLFLGGFFLAEAMRKTKIDITLLYYTLKRLGNKATSILAGLMALTAVLSMLMSNTATIAMILATISPLLQRQSKKSNFSQALLLGISIAASIGGMGTIIGTPPNAIAVGALEANGYSISFFKWMLFGVPIATILIFISYKILVRHYKIKNLIVSTDDIYNNLKPDKTKENDLGESNTQKMLVLGILFITLLLWLTSQWTKIPVSAASGVPIVFLTMLGIITAEDVRKLPWDTLMLVAGGLSIGIAIQEQGLAEFFAGHIEHLDISFGFILILLSFLAVILSNFMSNTAAATILVPLSLSMKSLIADADVNPILLPIIIGLCCSCAMLLPVSTPPNAIAYSTGLIKQKEFLRTGTIIGLLGPFIVITWVFYFL